MQVIVQCFNLVCVLFLSLCLVGRVVATDSAVHVVSSKLALNSKHSKMN